MGDSPSSGFVPDDCVSASVTDATAVGDTGQNEFNEPDRKFTVHRQLDFTVSYHVEGTAKPRLVRRFIKWLRK